MCIVKKVGFGGCVAEGARVLGVNPETIRAIMRKNKEKGKKWKSYGFLWVYKEDFMSNK